MGALSEWIHIDAIQALIHHATAVITAIFLFGVTGRLIAYLIPDGHAKKIVMLVDDVILLAVFVLAGWRLLNYMWFRPHPEDTVDLASDGRPAAVTTDELIAQCRKSSSETAALTQCLEQLNAQAKRALAQAAERMTADMRALDKAGNSKIGALHGFDTAQSAFLLYREAECRWRATTAGNGNTDLVYRACMASLARRRAAEIEDILRK